MLAFFVALAYALYLTIVFSIVALVTIVDLLVSTAVFAAAHCRALLSDRSVV